MPHSTTQNAAEGDKAWDLKDDFKYAPKSSAGDPWKALLDPLVEKEKNRCDAWNNEIQNLLIFAGLFSGLVTAFISQSYKTLQPDPNANLIRLLAVIAEGVNTSPSTAAKVASIASQPSSTFVPSSAAVRVNVCWFISLILSLTVILSGIIVMQWLREHQIFTGQSSRDKIAILNMRIEALDKWHVQNIITTFPLFLAMALVLFFAGMIEFLHILGNETVLVSVATVITILLVLLILTTILPTLQCIFLYIWILPHAPPSPCPYKSPQSGIIHAVCYYVSDFLASRSQRFRNLGTKLSLLSTLNTENQHALSYLSDTWSKKTWAEVDLCWLSVRQACVCSETGDGYHEFLARNDFPPLYDISKTLRDIVDGLKVAPEIVTAAYHCFYELLTPFAPSNHPHRKRGAVERSQLDSTFKLIVRRNQFLQSLMRANSETSQPHRRELSPNINFGKVTLRMEFDSYVAILHHQNMFLFVDRLANSYYAKEFHQHRVELGLRLANALYYRWYHIEHNLQEPFPPYLKGDLFDQHRFRMLRNDISVAVFQQYGHVLTTFFKGAADSHYDITPNCLLSHRGVAEFLEKAAWDTFRIMTTLGFETYSVEDRAKAVKIFQAILTQISSSLNASQSTKHRQPKNPVYLLYLTAIYVRRLNALRKQPGPCMDAAAVDALDATMAAMLVYKRNTVDIDGAGTSHGNAQLPRHILNAKDRFGSVQRFAPEWWSFLDGKHDTHVKDSEASPLTRIWWETRRVAPPPGAPVAPASTLPRQLSLHPLGGVVRSTPLRPSVSTGAQGTLLVYSKGDETGTRTPRTASSLTASSSAPAYVDAVHTNSDTLYSSEGHTTADSGLNVTASPIQQSSVSRIAYFHSLNSTAKPPQRTYAHSSLMPSKIETVEIILPSPETLNLNPLLESVMTRRTRTPDSHVQYPDPIYGPSNWSDNPYSNTSDLSLESSVKTQS